VVLTALAKDPNQRFKSVQAFANALEQAKPPLGTTLFTYRGHIGGANTVAWSPNGRRLASGSHDKTLQVWQTRRPPELLSTPTVGIPVM
jgi:WD40 repeat protein